MNRSEAYDLLAKKLAELLYQGRVAPLAEAGSPERFEVRGESGTIYQVEIQFHWEDKEHGKMQVVGSIDDGGKALVQALPWTLPMYVARKNQVINHRPGAVR